MAIDFPRSTYTAAEGVSAEGWPASPSNGDTQTNGAGDNFTFNGTSSLWVLDTGRTLTLSGGATYSWDGEKWIAQSHIPFRYFGPQDTDPTGLTADNEGDLYFNTVENEMRVYNGSSWDTITSVGNFNILTLSASSTAAPVGGTATFNGTATRFQLSETPNVAQQLLISINGVVQEPQAGTSPTDGFAVDGNDIIFASAPVTGASFFGVQMGAAVNIGTPTDGSVTNVHVNASAAIAGSKIDPDFGSQTIVTTGNVGIGTSSPNKPLHIFSGSSDAEIRLQTNSGTEQNSYITLRQSSGDLDLYTVSSGTNMKFHTVNSERMRIDSSGNVGIGTSSPQQNLQINDSVTPTIRFSRDSSYYWDIGHTNSDFQFNSESGGTIMHLNFNGNVGIGTTAPSALLHLAANAPYITFEDKDNNQDWQLQATAWFAIRDQTNNAERLRITSSGNVGIGTTSPSSLLEVFSSGSGTETIAEFGNSVIDGGLQIQTNGNLDWGFNVRNSRNLTFSTNQLERARIDSSGRLLVGTTSASSNDGVLVVQGYAGTTAGEGTLDLIRGNNVTAGTQGLGSINFGHDQYQGASIDAQSEGAWTESSSHPTRLMFSTTADGASSPTERMRITSDAYVRLASGTGGIQFGGDTAAANALDDYEVGTWTPSLSGSSSAPTVTASVAVGDYVKVGNVCTISWLMVLTSASGGSGNWYIQGAPFSPNSQSSYANVGVIGYNDVMNAGVDKCYIASTSAITLIPTGTTQSNVTYEANSISTGYLSGTITYKVN